MAEHDTFATITPLPAVRSLGMLTYQVPEDLRAQTQVGVRVIVPLGRRRITGLVAETSQTAPIGIVTKPVISVLDREPVVPAELLTLARWMSEYYIAPFAEVLSLAIGRGLTTSSARNVSLKDASVAKTPTEKKVVAALEEAGRALDTSALKKRTGSSSVLKAVASLEERGGVSVDDSLGEPDVKAKLTTAYRAIAEPEDAVSETLFGRAPRRREVFEYLWALPKRTANIAELQALFPNPKSQLDALETAGIVERLKLESYRELDLDSEADKIVELSADQQRAYKTISGALGSYESLLLHGVTSSGKTEVYLRAIADTLGRGESALVLVPEIPLTHQIVGRMVARFGPTVAVLHSELSSGERWDQWRRIARGEAQIVVGARSAVLAPLSNLGLICVDEEHDSAYKQEDGVRYNGRDVAVVRARQRGCPIVLGSATPSIESWRNAGTGAYTLVSMPTRVAGAELPSMEVVDLRGRDIVATGGLGEHLSAQVKRNFEEGGQTLLFLNRRGTASGLFCYQCGEGITCNNCSVSMTLHAKDGRLHCHYCDEQMRPPATCPSCHEDALRSLGLGTQRVEAAVIELLGPEARIARLDRDITAKKGASAELLRAWRAGRYDVMVGTQMIAKGHDAHGVTLVGVVQADMSISVPDFRAGERTFGLLSQVAGRAGRGIKRGRVIVQTYQPDHYAVAAAARHDYQKFADAEIKEREALAYPPFSRMAILRFEGTIEARTISIAEQAAAVVSAYAAKYQGPILRGPAPAPMERLRGRYRYMLQLRDAQSGLVRGAAAAVVERLSDAARKLDVRLLVDVDAVDML